MALTHDDGFRLHDDDDHDQQTPTPSTPATATPRTSRRVVVLRVVYAVLAIAIVAWGASLLSRRVWTSPHPDAPPSAAQPTWVNGESNSTTRLRFRQLQGDIKIFERVPSGPWPTNQMVCSGDYCSYRPDRVLCTELNAQPEDSSLAAWKCDGRTQNGYDIDSIRLNCQGGTTQGNPRAGCTLYLTMHGPFSGWSNAEVVAYFVLVFLFVVFFGPIVVIGGGDGSHMSSSFG